jgi:hypothetical protein
VNNAASKKILEKNGFVLSSTEKSPKNMLVLERRFDSVG